MKPMKPQYCQCKYPLIRVDPFNKEYCGKCDNYFEEIKRRKMKPITPQELSPNMSYVRYNGMILKVASVEHPQPLKDKRFSDKWIITLFCDGFITCTIDEIKPVELTEEILLRLGFTKIPHLVLSSLYELEIRKGYKMIISDLGTPNEMIGFRQGNDYVVVWNYDYNGKCALHNLQNIKSILGKELELKPKTDNIKQD